MVEFYAESEAIFRRGKGFQESNLSCDSCFLLSCPRKVKKLDGLAYFLSGIRNTGGILET